MTALAFFLGGAIGVFGTLFLSQFAAQSDEDRDGIPASFLTYGDEP